MNTDDVSSLPTFENRLAAYLYPRGIVMAPGEYLVRQARCLRRLASIGFDAEALVAVAEYLDRHPELLGDE